RSQKFLIQILFPGKRAVAVFDGVTARVRFAFQQPTKHSGTRRLFNPAGGGQAELELGAVRLDSFPMVADLPIANESALILAEIIAVGARNEFFLHFIDESIGPRHSEVLAVGRDPLVAAALQ